MAQRFGVAPPIVHQRLGGHLRHSQTLSKEYGTKDYPVYTPMEHIQGAGAYTSTSAGT